MNYKYLLLLPILLFLSCQKEDLANLDDSFTVRRNGANMPAYVHGNATSNTFLIILTGGPGNSGLSARSGWHQSVEAEYAVVYWDQRGTGMSQGKLSKENLSIEEMVKDVEALTQILKHKYGTDSKLFLLGHSWGGMLGTASLTTNNGKMQDLFEGWINVAGITGLCKLFAAEAEHFKAVGEAQISEGNDVAYWETAIELANDININSCLDSRLNAEYKNAETVLTKSGIINPAYEPTAFYSNGFQNNALITNNQGSLFNSFLGEDEGYLNLDLIPQLPIIALPTLVLHGKYDMSVPQTIGEAYFEAIGAQEKQFISFPKSGHQIFQTAHEEVATAIMEFMELHK